MANAGRNISLTDRHSRFVDEQVANGRHASGSEVVREAIRRYEADLEREEAHLDYLRRLGDVGEAALAAGDYVTLSSREELRAFIQGSRDRSAERGRRGIG
jgi:antitoxin ParD1/3/4